MNMWLLLQVLINSKTKEATCVQFMRNNDLQTVSASKEIILSAGAIGSPQILMLSGVGPNQHLKNLGVAFIIYHSCMVYFELSYFLNLVV